MSDDKNKMLDACSLTTELKWLTHQEAADYLRISKKALYNLCSQGKIEPHKLLSDRRNRYLVSELNELFFKKY